MENRIASTNDSYTARVNLPYHQSLNMRFAARFIEFSRRFHSDIHIRTERDDVDGKSMIGLLCLGVNWRTKLDIKAEGDDAEKAIKQIERFFSDVRNFA